MSTAWNSLYCPSDDTQAVTASLRESLAALGYQPYNPFSAFPGKSYPYTVRLFVAPAVGGWTRVIGAPDEEQTLSLSRLFPCLYLSLDGTQARIAVYLNGAPADPLTMLSPHLRAGRSPDDLRQVLSGRGETTAVSPSPSGLPFAALPEDVQKLAGAVDRGAAEKMFSRLSTQLMKKVGGQSDEARALIAGQGAPDWHSAGGQQIRRLMACLTIPDNWREPDFSTLRDAYALHERRRRNPAARLYPGDEDVMAAVPDALAYTPIYGGRN